MGTSADTSEDIDDGTYDAAVRSLVEVYLAEFVAWILDLIGLPPVAPDRLEQLGARFGRIVTTREADLLVRIAADRLLQVEYESHPKAGLALRMLEYRNLIMHRYPGNHLNQVVLVLVQGAVDSIDDDPGEPADSGFRLGLSVLKMREQHAEQLVRRTGIEPLALLAGTDVAARSETLGLVLVALIARDDERSRRLIAIAVLLARRNLPMSTIDRVLQEADVTTRSELFAEFRDAPFIGQAIREELAHERDQGEVAGRAGLFASLLRARFGAGDFVEPLAQVLAEWDDDQAALDLIAASASPEALRAAIGEHPNR